MTGSITERGGWERDGQRAHVYGFNSYMVATGRAGLFWVSHVAGGTPALGPSFAALPGTSVRNWIRSEAVRTWISIYTGLLAMQAEA